METRLDSSNPLLAKELRSSPIVAQWNAAAHACEIAITKADVHGVEINEGMAALSEKVNCDKTFLTRIDKLIENLDNEYFRLEEMNDESSLRYFSKARATSSLKYALGMTTDSYLEAIYEAMSAVDDSSEIEQKIAKELHSFNEGR